MCMISVVMDYPILTDKLNQDYSWLFSQPNTTPIVPIFDFEGYKIYAELLRKAAEYDKIMNEPNCHDPKKLEFLKTLMARMDTLGEEFQKISQDIKQLFDEANN